MTGNTVGLTPGQMAERLAAYRSRHTIAPVPAWDGNAPVCDTDGVRLVRRRSRGPAVLWRHDPDEIKALSEGADYRLLASLTGD